MTGPASRLARTEKPARLSPAALLALALPAALWTLLAAAGVGRGRESAPPLASTRAARSVPAVPTPIAYRRGDPYAR